LNDGISEDRRLLRSTLMRWLSDPDMAALCEPGALKMLHVEERDEWLALWKGAMLSSSERPAHEQMVR
jgi:hypothetical protein